MISVRNLTKSYGKNMALRGISFDVQNGEIIGLLGPNGAGKTTTMKILTGYLQPTEGQATVDGIDVVEDPISVQQKIGYLPENAPIYLDMAVQEYLQFGADLRDISEHDRRHLISEAVYATGLEDHLTRPISDLSKGYRQRVGLAYAIMHKPKLLILDEPTNGLDPTQIHEVRSLIKRLSEHATVMVSTHILQEVEATCHRAIIIIDGEIKADAQLAELTSTTSAVAAVQDGASNVASALQSIEGVHSVQSEMQRGDFTFYRVNAKEGTDLCPLIFDLACKEQWRLTELRQDTRTLDSVFRELAITNKSGELS
ncbi:MAG: ATP-binding cassette domain-containing protein [Myxococcota bacterium]|nr:ATP-binding cassette domain-containing protein [Myxococcota bacterium]